MPAMTKLAENTEKAAAVIPDLYYDLIARVVPGTTVLSYLIFVLRPDSLNALAEDISFWPLLVGGYVLGMALVSMAWPVFNVVWRMVYFRRNPPWNRAELIKKLDGSLSAAPELGRRLWKSYAEMAAAEALVLGFTLVAVWDLWRVEAVTLPRVLGWVAIVVALVVVLHTRVTIVRQRAAGIATPSP